ncbi:MAG TPA: hypothetical protein VMW91_01225 [Desulfosporosinus sp.]|nr:hypothetical protein [Desulfosporosinus sp.]
MAIAVVVVSSVWTACFWSSSTVMHMGVSKSIFLRAYCLAATTASFGELQELAVSRISPVDGIVSLHRYEVSIQTPSDSLFLT